MSSSISSQHHTAGNRENTNYQAGPEFSSASQSRRFRIAQWKRNWQIRVEKRIMDHLHRYWHGPSLCAIVEDRRYQLGHGNPHVEVVVHQPALIRQLWLSPLLTFGEAYMRGDIEVHGSLKSMMHAFHATKPEELSPWHCRWMLWLSGLPKTISSRQATANAQHHYDIGSEFYKLWLDPSLSYSCAYYLRGTDDLATAQRQKLELLCRKARLSPGQTLLDIGCGWGALLVHAARHYGVQTTGVTPARDQAIYIEALARREGLEDRIHVLRGDWRDVDGSFDRIISVGMFEHVGLKQYRQFFLRWKRLLADGGLSILHTIGRMIPTTFDPWMDKYIFPGGHLPTLTQLAHYVAATGMCVVDVENLKRHYAKTLEDWLSNFNRAKDQTESLHGRDFVRMWSLYLHGAEAAFRWGELQLWQMVLAKDHRHPWPLDREVNVVDTPEPPNTAFYSKPGSFFGAAEI